jgi:hypothetical protein
MVAVIHSSKSVRNVLHYNENKVRLQVAKLIHSSGYAKDAEGLTFSDKIKTFTKRMELNERTKVNTVHISLNFHPGEKLPDSMLRQISESYMSQIGFAAQPYLVYRHNDSAHPHIHIVSTNIRLDGSRIALHNLGKNQSEKARKDIEKNFRLLPAEYTLEVSRDVRKEPIKKVVYSSSNAKGIKHEIETILDSILPVYRYTSLAELNAILMQYNVSADGGSSTSRVFRNKGLTYRPIDINGRPVGIPLAASSFKSKPTLSYLQAKFQENKTIRLKHKTRIKNAIDLAIRTNTLRSLGDLKAFLAKENIHIVHRQNAQGRLYGLTYVDHKTKCVFNGSDLGKMYSANAMMLRLEGTEWKPKVELSRHQATTTLGQLSKDGVEKRYRPSDWQVFKHVREIFGWVMAADPSLSFNPDLLDTIKRKKRKKPRI